ncbi:NAD-dependent epimerase/dehydratase family protein [Jeotgalibaca caeni]|uniref:NAD-dependent epimerase/dehydratase family protein n=1 Tax=Jeotgalibaca caeni TaxID=3028623 RepID=UPI00237E7277|nr:NAD-dependent epimerase/dehydratase family protein [Jeotgalibaca caeni]MDE1549884.1 NAD-dependent epimerase/dehydratase family protein [Jeotgalibaca caeni]
MKKILITGANSYVGTSFEKWVAQYPESYDVDTVDMKAYSWRERNFSEYDVVLHVAGIAHIKETKENEELYYKVNRDLAFEAAKKAKTEGVKQFIFLSSMSVYGMETGVIDQETPTNPKNAYGKSKLEAENLILELTDESFAVSILRPPMIYGKGCQGNYPKLANLARKTPVFPEIDNKRSMIYIDNLSEFIRLIADNCDSGIFFPQNKDYVKTSDMVKRIAFMHHKNVKMTNLFNIFLKGAGRGVISKVFGDLVYKQNLSEYPENYWVFNLDESIKLTER